MPFETDNWNGNKKGRPQGALNKRTEQWIALSESIINKHAAKFNQELDKLSGKDFWLVYSKVLSFFKPK